ncbi:MAG TPA: hypothetical protein VNJ07_09910 [Chitinophagales bacterium]|nr:hypothetical protein [Chitinophagales bacterium]
MKKLATHSCCSPVGLTCYFKLPFIFLLMFIAVSAGTVQAQTCPNGTDAECDDGNSCTDDVCDLNTFDCAYSDNTSACDDGDVCTGGDVCNSGFCAGTPQYGCTDPSACNYDPNALCDNFSCYYPSPCDDGNACTDNDILDCFGICAGTPSSGASCDDGDACTGGDVCNSGFCAGTPQYGCTDPSACNYDPNALCDNSTCYYPTPCDDGDACTENDMLDCFGICAGTTIDCNDNDACYDDYCDPFSGCYYVVVVCNDNDACTDDACDPATGCVYTPHSCDDGDYCTDDYCNPANGCFTLPHCDDGDICTIDICKVEFDDDDDGERDDDDDGDHDDDDGDDDDDNGGIEIKCRHTPLCDDGNPCTVDACDALGNCTSTPKDCNDNNLCTTDYCDRNGRCRNKPINCSDGNSCTIDFCDAQGACQHTPKDCNDNNPCTRDLCVEGRCKYVNTAPKVNAGPNATVYIGYGPSCATLTALASGGTPGYNYFWSTGETTGSVSVCPAASTVYCVTVTDANGCIGKDCVRVCVADIRCANGVLVCHRGSNGRTTTCVPVADVPAHLAHGDKLGRCGYKCEDDDDDDGHKMSEEDLSEDLAQTGVENVEAYPNPFSERLSIDFSLTEDSHAKLEIFNIAGQKLATLFEGNVKAGAMQKVEFVPAGIAEGMIFYRLQTKQGAYFGKAVMVK